MRIIYNDSFLMQCVETYYILELIFKRNWSFPFELRGYQISIDSMWILYISYYI